MRRARPWRPGATSPACTIAIPHLPRDAGAMHLQALLNFLLSANDITDFVAWYYTPMALEFTGAPAADRDGLRLHGRAERLRWRATGLRDKERALLTRADFVLTGGRSLYEAKRSLHVNVHECPSSVDVPISPAPGRHSPSQRINTASRILGSGSSVCSTSGSIATCSPDVAERVQGGSSSWWVPLRRSRHADLPAFQNIHYLGPKSYKELPELHRGLGRRHAALRSK